MQSQRRDPRAAQSQSSFGSGRCHNETHECAGLNVCKGLGGCKVSEEKLAKLASARGIDLSKAGSAHDCAGLNECKGLGGCAVDDKRLEQLSKNLQEEK